MQNSDSLIRNVSFPIIHLKILEEVHMKIRIISLFVVVLFALSILGCRSIPEERKGAAAGAGVGAVTGAAAGAILGSKGAKTEMAVLGGLVGALVGGAVGHYTYDKKRDRQETAQRYNYQPTAGSMLRIENAAVSPSPVRPGDTVNLNATYAVLTPAPADTVSVTEVREIKHQGTLIGNPQVTVNRNGGTFTSSVPLILPEDAKKGTYSVVTTIQSGVVRDSRETAFTVQ